MNNLLSIQFRKRFKMAGAILITLLGLSLILVMIPAFVGAEEKITIRFAHCIGADRKPAYDKLIRQFEAEHPNVKINFEIRPWSGFMDKLTVEAAAGAMPDIFYFWSIVGKKFVDSKLILNLTPFMHESHVDVNDFVAPDIVKDAHGNVYTLPYDTNARYMAFNADLFNKSALPLPSPDWTWNDFAEYVRKLTKDFNGDGKMDQWGYEGFEPASFNEMYLMGFGGRWIAEDGKTVLIDTPQVREALNFWAGLRKEGLIPDASDVAGLPLGGWGAGKSAMRMTAQSWLSIFCGQLKFKWGGQYLPANKGVKRATLGLSGFFAISAKTKHPKEVWEFMKFLTSVDAQNEIVRTVLAFPANKGSFPTFVKVYEEASNRLNVPMNLEAIVKSTSFAQAPSLLATGKFLEIDRVISAGMEAIWGLRKSVDEVVKSMTEEVKSIL